MVPSTTSLPVPALDSQYSEIPPGVAFVPQKRLKWDYKPNAYREN